MPSCPEATGTQDKRKRDIKWLGKSLIGVWFYLVIIFASGKPSTGSTVHNIIAPAYSKSQGNEPRRVASVCRAHAHNDYHQADPLLSALFYGFRSVEVDVFPRNSTLLVGHTFLELDPKKTIDKLYIQPLLSLLQRTVPDASRKIAPGRRSVPLAFLNKKRKVPFPRGGSANSIAFNLLVDFKGDAKKSTFLLQEALEPLRPYLSKVDYDGKFIQGKITVLISGNRPSVESLKSEGGERFLFLDGRMCDIQSNTDSNLVPLVSLPWRQLHLPRVVGRGEAYMRKISERAHAQGKRVRIWGAPNREKVWKQMIEGDIDLLSVDDHAKFARFVAVK
jgi:hypothetical protein